MFLPPDEETEALEGEMKPNRKKSPKILREVGSHSGSQSASLPSLPEEFAIYSPALLR